MPTPLTSGLCIHPPSPTLLPLHRLLYYLSLLLSLLYPTPPPLIKGAFAYSLTYAATSALYAILILALPTSPSSPTNLDILPLWPILATAAIALPALLHWNPNLAPRSPARPLIRAWGLLITAATVCAYLSLRPIAALAQSNTTTVAQCLAAPPPRHPLRNPAHAALLDPAVFATPLLNRVLHVTPPLTFVPLFFGALGCLFTIPPAAHAEVSASAELLQDGHVPAAFAAVHVGYLRLRGLVVSLTPAVWVVVVVLGEMFLLGPGMRGVGTEEVYEVGQWGVWVGVALVGAAAGVAWMAGGRKEGGLRGVVGEFGDVGGRGDPWGEG